MRAVRSTPPGVTVVDVDEPTGAGEVVEIRSVGICASDLTYIRWGSTMILGHELAGVTDDGTPVAVEGIVGCDGCEQCDQGRVNLCVSGPTALGVTRDGGMSERFLVPASALVPLPHGLAVSDACLVEPAAVAWHACRLAGVGPDTRVAVVGGGAIGLLAVAAARAMGAPEVALEARHAHRREVAERLRAVGYCRHEGGRHFEDAARMLASTPDLVDALITHRFPLEDAPDAFRVASDKSTGALRVVVEP